MSPLPPSFNSNSVCIRTRTCYSLPTVDHQLSPVFSFHALTNPSSTLIDLQVLYFHTLTNPFSRNAFPFTSIQNARVSRGCFWLPTLLSASAPAGSGYLGVEKPPNSLPHRPLRTLEISFPSFSTSRPLFSIVCGLFLQNRGVWGGRTRKTKLVWGKKVTSGSSAASARSARAPSRRESID